MVSSPYRSTEPPNTFAPLLVVRLSPLACLDTERTELLCIHSPGPGTGAYKLGVNYAPGILPQKQAALQGYAQNLWLHGPEHYLTEVGTMNLFVVFRKDNGGQPSTIHLESADFNSLTRLRTRNTPSRRHDPSWSNT
jgi:branched-subunit amino acid aminotransferase/4-amino-4-deoxychorismate lyase